MALELDHVHDHLGDVIQGDEEEDDEEVAVGEDDDHDLLGGGDDEVAAASSPTARKSQSKKKRDSAGQLRKAPGAPKRFKSSYICFFTAKQAEIKQELGDQASVSLISKRSAELWKSLSPEQRAYWDDVAAKDKQRYTMEKAAYQGPWQVPWKRARKDPSAPKRPMSAFLFFALGRRARIKNDNPELKNTEVSRILGDMWRSMSPEQRQPYVDREKSERDKYKIAVAEWKENESRLETERKAHAVEQQMMYQSDASGAMYQDPYIQAPYAYGGSYNHPYAYPSPPVFTAPAPHATSKLPIILAPNGQPRYPVPYPTIPQPPAPHVGDVAVAPHPLAHFAPGMEYDPHHHPETFGAYGTDGVDGSG